MWLQVQELAHVPACLHPAQAFLLQGLQEAKAAAMSAREADTNKLKRLHSHELQVSVLKCYG